VEWTGYTRKHAIRLLNHGNHDQQTIQRHRLPHYHQEVQQALFLARKAAHYVCAKRLLPSLPTLVALLERHGHLHLTEEERGQLLTMSMSTAERYLRTQRKPYLHGLVTTTPGSLSKSQIPVWYCQLMRRMEELVKKKDEGKKRIRGRGADNTVLCRSFCSGDPRFIAGIGPAKGHGTPLQVNDAFRVGNGQR
jgi:hypothetical protein